eukprot:6489004-Amphidinium_carterae.1
MVTDIRKQRRARRERSRRFSSSDYKEWAVLSVLEEAPDQEDLQGISAESGAVFLSVYDLGGSIVVTHVNDIGLIGGDRISPGGIFHTGVEVYGKEYSFGHCDDGPGISCIEPHSHPDHKFRLSLPLGVTQLLEEEVDHLIESMSGHWLGSDYEVLSCNCLTFSNELAFELGVGNLPSWIDRSARAVSSLQDISLQAAELAFVVACIPAEHAKSAAVHAEGLLETFLEPSPAAARAGSCFGRGPKRGNRPSSEEASCRWSVFE